MSLLTSVAPSHLAGIQTPLTGPKTPLAGPQTSQPADGPMDGWIDKQMEFLSILQDFVACQGRCPAFLCDFTTSKKQGKGTADLMMPFGVLFHLQFFFNSYVLG